VPELYAKFPRRPPPANDPSVPACTAAYVLSPIVKTLFVERSVGRVGVLERELARRVLGAVVRTGRHDDVFPCTVRSV
jgi:hypothetical protein